MGFTRFVAIGDSLTEGKGDVYPNGELRGFADMLSHSLQATSGEAVYANLARPSVRAHEVRRDQVPQAVAMAPDLVTAIAGVNDVIAMRFRPRQVAEQVEGLFADLRRALPGTTIATAVLPDIRQVSALARVWHTRVTVLNDVVRESAARHDLVLADMSAEPPLGREEIALDRVHPSPLGHRRIAEVFAEALGLPAPDPSFLQPRPRAEALYRLYRTAVVAPRFITKRLARNTLIAGQPAKRPELDPV